MPGNFKIMHLWDNKQFVFLQGCRYYDPLSRSYLIESSDSEGVKDADFLLYVAANNTNRCRSSVAYATYCQLEVNFVKTDRSVFVLTQVDVGAPSTLRVKEFI